MSKPAKKSTPVRKPTAKKSAPKKAPAKAPARKKAAAKPAPSAKSRPSPPKKAAVPPPKKAAPAPRGGAKKPAAKTAKSAPPKLVAKKSPLPPAKKTLAKKHTPEPKAAPKNKAPEKGAKPAPAKSTARPAPDAKKKSLPKVVPTSVRKFLKGKGEDAADAKSRVRQEQMDKLLAMRGVAKPAPAPKAAPPPKPAPEPAPPPPPRPPKKRRKSPYTKTELNTLRAVLVEERQRLLHDIDVLDDNLSSNKETPNLTFSSHQADAATDASSMETSLIQRRMEETRLAEVTEALMKLDQGNYGLCEFCVHEEARLCETCPWIPSERLAAKPFAKMCIQMRRLKEKNRL